MTPLAISFDDIERAQKRLAGVAHRTPVLTSKTADERTGARLFFKCENFQRTGAFKFRGAFNAISQFTPAQRANGVVAFSSGNHAQAIALSARLLGVKAVIVMPTDAPAIKLAATRGYGAEVVLYDRYAEDREAIGRRLAEERGLNFCSALRPSAGDGGSGNRRQGTDRGRRPARPVDRAARRRRPVVRLRHRRQGDAARLLGDRRRAGGRKRRAAQLPLGPHRSHRRPRHHRRRRPDPASRGRSPFPCCNATSTTS